MLLFIHNKNFNFLLELLTSIIAFLLDKSFQSQMIISVNKILGGQL